VFRTLAVPTTLNYSYAYYTIPHYLHTPLSLQMLYRNHEVLITSHHDYEQFQLITVCHICLEGYGGLD